MVNTCEIINNHLMRSTPFSWLHKQVRKVSPTFNMEWIEGDTICILHWWYYPIKLSLKGFAGWFNRHARAREHILSFPLVHRGIISFCLCLWNISLNYFKIAYEVLFRMHSDFDSVVVVDDDSFLRFGLIPVGPQGYNIFLSLSLEYFIKLFQNCIWSSF